MGRKKTKRTDNLDLRDGIYYSDFYVAGRRIRRSLETSDYAKAKTAVAVLVERAWKAEKLGVATVTFAHAAAEYISSLDMMSNPPATLEEKRSKARWLVEALGISMMVRDVTEDVILDIVKSLRQRGVVFKKSRRPISDTTINRYLAELSVILRFAKSKGWIKSVPDIKGIGEDNKRTRWLTQQQAAKLLSELPPHLTNLVRFSLATGLRKSNATQLRWNQVNVQQRVCWIHPEDSKSRKAISIPLSDEAMNVLREQAGKHDSWVFPYEGSYIANPASGAFRKALVRAGIEDFHWHDLRHTWATWHVQNGTPLGVLQSLGGWSSYEMVLRYAVFAPDHLAQFANNSKAPAMFAPVVNENDRHNLDTVPFPFCQCYITNSEALKR